MDDVKFVVIKPRRSLAAALLLAVFFGPVGLLYASFWGGVIMSVLGLIAMLLPGSVAGFLGMLVWVICPFWSVFVVSKSLDRCCCQQHKPKA